MSDVFETRYLHGEEQIASELKAMIGASDLKITLGTIAGLKLLESPYLSGGEISLAQILEAYGIIEHGGMSVEDFHIALQGALDDAFRVFETIVPEKKPEKDHKESKIGLFSPEWFADMIASACGAMPSLTYKQVLYEIPLAMTTHLVVAYARKNGAITERPVDIKDALAQLRKHNEDKRNEQ